MTAETMKPLATNCCYGLGDNFVHLNWLRRAALAYPALRFRHFAPVTQLHELRPIVADLGNVSVEGLDAEIPDDCVDVWRGAGGWWYAQPDQNDFVAHSLRWFDLLAQRLGIENPVRCREQMLFDYPALEASREFKRPTLDVLLIDGEPRSGQFRAYDRHAMHALWADLSESNRVLTTNQARELGMNLTDIGAAATRARWVVGVSTGPSWPTMNRWAVENGVQWLLLLDHERVNICPDTTCTGSWVEARAILRSEGLLK